MTPQERAERLDNALQHAEKVGFWQYWLLPMWAVLRHPLNTNEWYLQLSHRTEMQEKSKRPKTTSYQRYLIKVKEY